MSNEVKSIKKVMDMEYEDLKNKLVQLRKYLDYKNSNFCKKFLDEIIKKCQK